MKTIFDMTKKDFNKVPNGQTLENLDPQLLFRWTMNTTAAGCAWTLWRLTMRASRFADFPDVPMC